MLHVHPKPQAPVKTPEAPVMDQGPAEGSSGVKKNNHVTTNFQVILSTALVPVKDHTGMFQLCRAFLDSGSEASFISEECARRLGLKRQHSKYTISGIGNAAAGITNGKLTMSSTFNSRLEFYLETHVMNKVTSTLPTFKAQVNNWSHLNGIQLADPAWHEPGRVDILIGGDYFTRVLLAGRRPGPPDAPVAQETIFGLVLLGPAPVAPSFCAHHVSTSEFDIVKRFWELEEYPGQKRILTADEALCEGHFTSTVTRDENNKYVVGIPYNEKKAQLGRSRDIAVKRLLQVERRLQRQPELRKQYAQFMNEYEHLGHMEEITTTTEAPGSTNYLPHHCVVNNGSSTTKLRVVFDGSAKTDTGVSLNVTLRVGPTVQDDLYDILLRFRVHHVAVNGDITKMYRQFRLTPEDADMHRIVWRDDPTTRIKDYRLLTVTYGTSSAPYLATRCLQQLATDSAESHPVAAAALKDDAYVDDLMSGKANTNEAIHLVKELNEVMLTANMELRKWSSNDPAVLATIPPDRQECNPSDFDTDHTVKALGVQWHPKSDQFKLKYNTIRSDETTLTKRLFLSELARVFDPLGLIAPITIRGKIIMQELWKTTTDWDDPVPASVEQLWSEYEDDLKNIPQFHAPRCITGPPTATYELHGFADASEKALGAVIYLKVIEADAIRVNLVTAKSRVAPQVSLPRLELVAAVLLAELATQVLECLKIQAKVFLWSDSTITLTWIKSPPRRWKTFVANRVAIIQELTNVDSWRHVPGVSNPADLISRGVSVDALTTTDVWTYGPTWLNKIHLPVFSDVVTALTDVDQEERQTKIQSHLCELEASLLNRYSSYIKLLRVTAYILRWKTSADRHGELTPSEIRYALYSVIKIVQRNFFGEELQSLRANGKVKSLSKLQNLCPYVDSNGLMRVSGRLHHSNVVETKKHQIILPANCHFTEILIWYYHTNNLHAGFQFVFSTICTEFWILGGRDKVRHLLRKCVICGKHRAKTAEQLMGSLPSARVNPARPFLHTGVDFAGPFILKNPIGRAPKTYKEYMCLFICMATKAVHLDAVSSLITDAFLDVFHRFFFRRGLPAHLYSDCGTNFVGAEKELSKLFSNSSTKLANEGVTWHFNPPSAPHHGGLREAAVKSAKYHLRRIIGNSPLTYDKFTTLLCQVEGILNSRPLSPMSSDPADLNVLTPGHFLIGDSIVATPDPALTHVKQNKLNQFQLQLQRIQHFWRRWSAEYLNTLQQRNKWYMEKENLKPGDLVLVKEDTTSPTNWKLGRILKTHPGSDNRVRVVTLQTSTGELQRPIVKCIPLLT